MLISTKYLEAWEDNKILCFRWLPPTSEMSVQEYFEHLEESAKVIEKAGKQYICLDTSKLNFTIPLNLHDKINDILLPAYEKSSIKKLAIVMPQELIKNLSISETISKQKHLHDFESKYFPELEAAKEWLLA